jgi:spermidine synthase
MSNITKKLLILAGLTSDRNTVLKFCEPAGSSRDVLFKGLLDGSYSKPFLIEDREYRTMCFALDGCAQTEMRLDDHEALVSEYTRKMMGFLVFQARPRRVLMIGLGGGSLVKYCHRHLATTQVTAVEIDSDVIALRSQFLVPPDGPRLQVINEEGARYVAQMADRGDRTDVILVDAYDQFGIAKAVVERDFVENAKLTLGTHGIFVMNLVAEADDCSRHVETIRQVFGGPVIVIAMKRDSNLVVFAGNALLDPRRMPLALRNAERFEGKLGLFFPTLMKHVNESHRQLGLGRMQCA